MKLFRNWSYLIFLCIFFTCTEEDIRDHGYPTITTSLVEISTQGVTFSGTIQFENLEEIIDHGFVWGSERGSLSLNESLYVSLGPVTSQNFSATIGSTLEKKIAYYTRSYAKTKGKTVYGPVVRFVSLGNEGPKITAFSPTEGSYGDTVIITGKNFVFKKEMNLVTIGDVPAVIARATDTELKVVVGKLNKVSNAVKVSIIDNITEASGAFVVKPPVVQSVLNPVFTVCDTIFIQGENLTAFGATPTVKLNGYQAWSVIVTPKQIKVTMPTLVQNPVSITITSPLFEITPSISLTQVTPEITSIDPLQYVQGDTITVSVKNWPACAPINARLINQSYYGYDLVVAKASAGVVKLIAPEYCLPTSKLQLLGYSITIGSNLELKPQGPVITSVEPDHGTVGDEVIIRGKNLGTGWLNQFNSLMDVTSTTSTGIRGRVKALPWVHPLTVSVSAEGCVGNATLSDAFTFDVPEIHSISPTLITQLSDVITITGKNFSPTKTRIEFGGIGVGPTFSGVTVERDRITIPARHFFINQQLTQQFTGKIKVSMGLTLNAFSSQDLTIDYQSIWRTEPSFPGMARLNAVFMTINGKGYTGLAANSYYTLHRDWWQFDPISGWTKLADFPEGGEPIFSQTAVVDGKGYFGFLNSTRKWWQYDPSTDQWNRKADFPGTARLSGFTFVAQGKVYVGGGMNLSYTYFTDFWEYDPATDQWTQKASLPADARVTLPTGFEHQGKGFTFGLMNDDVSMNFVYDPATNEWASRAVSIFNTPNFFSGWSVMKFDDFIIVHSTNYFSPQVYKYDPENNSFTTVASTYGFGPSGQSTFVINNRGYMGLGYDSYTNRYLTRMLSFDGALIK